MRRRNLAMYIAFTTDKNGRRIAYRMYSCEPRWFRVALAEAELLVATGRAEQVPYVKWQA